MRLDSWVLFFALAVASVFVLAMSDPAKKFIDEMDQAPPDKRVPHWEHTKALMARVAPAVGELAPDFSLKTLDGKETIALSNFKGDRPVVLIFGSYT